MYIHTHPRSPFCVKAEWALLELGLSYERKLLEFGNAEAWTKVVEDAKGGPATIPLLVNGDFSLTESGAIVYYAESQMPTESTYLPRDPTARARVMQWERLADFEALGIGMTYHQNSPDRLKKSGLEANTAALATAKEKFDKLAATLETVLTAQKYLASPSHFTFGDTAMACYFMMTERAGGPTLSTPSAKRWYAEASNRPAYLKLIS